MIAELSLFLPLAQGIAFQPIMIHPQDTRMVTVTAYSSTHDQTDSTPFITAANKKVKDGIVAINDLEFGTKVMFPDLFPDKTFEVWDRKHKRYNSGWADIWMLSRDKAKQFGIKKDTKMIVLN